MENGVAFCPACGQPALSSAVPNAGMAAPSSSVGATVGGYAPVVPSAAAPVAYGRPVVQYAGFWLRVVAHLIDGIVFGLAFLVVFVPFALMTGLFAHLGRIHPGDEPRDVGAILGGTFFLGILTIAGIGLVAQWLYFAKMESSAWQATLGKKALNLRVTDLAGAPITFGRASGRFFAKMITGLIPLGVGFMLAGLTERRQALHDMLASCLVLRDG